MSGGNPLETRHPIKGLEPGDRFAYTTLSLELCSDEIALKKVMKYLTAAYSEPSPAILILVIPQKRLEAVRQALSS